MIMGKYFRPALLTLFYLASFLIPFLIVLIFVMLHDYDKIKFSSDDSLDIGENTVELLRAYEPLAFIAIVFLNLAFVKITKMTDFHGVFDCNRINWRTSWIPILGSLCFVFVAGIVSSVFFEFTNEPEMPGNESTIRFLVQPLYYVLNVVFIEFLFREAIIKSMLSNGATYIQAIIFSSICYSLSRFYPSIMLVSFFVGIAFAIIYIKTRSIVLTSIIHVVLSLFSTGEDYFTQSIGFELKLPLHYNIIMVLLLLFTSYKLLRYYWNEPLPSEKKAELEELVSK